jgi:hypothetical protein
MKTTPSTACQKCGSRVIATVVELLNPGTSGRKALVAIGSPRLATKDRGAIANRIEIETLADEKNFYVFNNEDERRLASTESLGVSLIVPKRLFSSRQPKKQAGRFAGLESRIERSQINHSR